MVSNCLGGFELVEMCRVTKKKASVVSLTGVQALGDRGRLYQVTSAQVTGDEMVKVLHQVLPSRGSHVWSLFF